MSQNEPKMPIPGLKNVMKERMKNMGWQNDTEKLKRRDQVAVIRLRTGYIGAKHRNKINSPRTQTARFAAQKAH
jgi:hypothetical protein